ncbi:hypothetical protein [Sphingobacterium bambusae]|uniref:Uncharacterized protein n=1 Tax=Sphingobacterium bambusae TaxID=662858 RepID=A0ABW6BE56_9SPHI|nr:hypothetical protein [Sphingobacterium bambusae]WPL47541.1 hypothetical protein SCB77_16425 [Sphingobacterium bambusae]
MIRNIAILFSAMYLLATTHLIELLKLPILIEHYAEYQGDLLDFVVHHYGGHEKDADWDTDMKLPFMKSTPVMMVLANVPDNITVELPNVSILPAERDTCYYQLGHCFNYLSPIFQPPRFC